MKTETLALLNAERAARRLVHIPMGRLGRGLVERPVAQELHADLAHQPVVQRTNYTFDLVTGPDGRVSLPVFSFLELSASARWDKFSTLGSTTNPTLGAKLKPTDWLTIYGHWGKSYNAPTSLDLLATSTAILFTNNCVNTPCINYKTSPSTTYNSG